MKNKMIAMILAGGKGTRLESLTKKVAKPAVHFGGKYRIIDFPVSNCANSGIDIVGVLTQYESVLLNAYAAAGQKWGLDTKDSGVFVLPPREKEEVGLNIYRGTADAISQNIDFIDSIDPEYLLILSGDHIYKMNYSKMLKKHQENNADVTIAVLNVSLEEASRFGIMNADATGKIYEFEEKPKFPKSTLASMGIYIFNWKQLRKELINDMSNPNSSHDFGKDIIPSFLKQEKRLFTYEFSGYWKDVGTLDSLWEANMDLLNPQSDLEIDDPSWKIYTEDVANLPHYVGKTGSVKKSIINQGCVIEGLVNSSVLFGNVSVDHNAKVTDSVLMPDVEIGSGAILNRVIVAPGVKIGSGCIVGSAKSKNIELISKNVKGEN